MVGPANTKVKPLISKALNRARKILGNEEDLTNLVGSASLKLKSYDSKIKSGKNDAVTLLDMIKAWVSGEYREVPRATLLLCVAALIYFVNPFDAIPDILPATGLLDDVTVIGFVLASIKEDVERFRSWRTDRTDISPFKAPISV
jgi:uncharacterized membrane protein YkvA (DUF1232 family)